MPTPITKKGHEALQAELDRLRKVERAKNIEAIAEARAHGDLSENAEYGAAKERQGFIESRIVELQSKLADARIVETTGRISETIVFGATVLVIEQESQSKRLARTQAGGLAARSVNILFPVCLSPSRARLWSLPRPLLQGGQPPCRIPTKGAHPLRNSQVGRCPTLQLRAPVSLGDCAISRRTVMN